MKVIILALIFCAALAFADEEHEFKRYIFTTHKKNAIGVLTSRPLFAGLVTQPEVPPVTPVYSAVSDTWVCWRLPLYDLKKKKIGEAEDCIDTTLETAIGENLYYAHVSTLKIKEKGKLVIAWTGESSTGLGDILANSGYTDPTIIGTIPTLPGRVLNTLSTGVFRHLEGTCQVNGLIDTVQWFPTIGLDPPYGGPLHFNRLYWDCRMELDNDGDGF